MYLFIVVGVWSSYVNCIGKLVDINCMFAQLYGIPWNGDSKNNIQTRINNRPKFAKLGDIVKGRQIIGEAT